MNVVRYRHMQTNEATAWHLIDDGDAEPLCDIRPSDYWFREIHIDRDAPVTCPACIEAYTNLRKPEAQREIVFLPGPSGLRLSLDGAIYRRTLCREGHHDWVHYGSLAIIRPGAPCDCGATRWEEEVEK